MSSLNRTLATSSVVALIFMPSAWAQSSSFGDLQGYWGGQYVTTLAERGIIGGFPDGTFKPNAEITRAQFAAIAVKAFNLPSGNSTRNFRDVPANYWGSPAIIAVSNSGLVTGFPDGSFRPEEKITRAQALVILSKALGNNTNANPNGLNAYGDRQAVPEWAMDSVARAANAGIIVNFPDATRIDPNNLATRGEVAGLVYQTLVKLGNGNYAPINIGLNNAGNPGPTPTPTPPPLTSLQIDRIETNSNPRQPLRQGDDLIIRAYGTPGASAIFELEGLNRDRPVAMQEIQSGIYETTYRIRRGDRQINARPMIILSRSGQSSVSRQFDQAIVINIDNADYPNNPGNPGNIGYTLRPEITNFINDDVIRLPDNLMGQTLPDANVEVTMEALRNVMGMLNLSQTVFQSTVRADQTGRFTVYIPKINANSGTMYRVKITATQNNDSQSSELVLRQE